MYKSWADIVEEEEEEKAKFTMAPNGVVAVRLEYADIFGRRGRSTPLVDFVKRVADELDLVFDNVTVKFKHGLIIEMIFDYQTLDYTVLHTTVGFSNRYTPYIKGIIANNVRSTLQHNY